MESLSCRCAGRCFVGAFGSGCRKISCASTTFARGASVIEKALGIDTSQFEYFTAKKGKYGPESLPDWQLLFVIGIVIGAFISSTLSGDFKIQAVPDMWRKKFGSNPVKRGIVAFSACR